MIELNDDIVLVKGAKNAAIYNFNDGKVYSINDVAISIIDNVLVNHTSPKNDIEKDYIKSLINSKLLRDNCKISPYTLSKDESICLNFAWIELTNVCNYRCLHCYEGNDHCHLENALTLKRWKDILYELKISGCKRIQITGGEPASFKGLDEILEYASSLNFDEITLFTNTSLLSLNTISIISKNNIIVRFSIYGHTPHIHDLITQCPGSFDKTINNIRIMQSKNIQILPHLIIMKENEEYLKDIVSFINSLGLKYSGFDTIRCVYNGEQSKHLPLNKDIANCKYISKPDFKASKSHFEKAFSKNTCWYGKIAIDSTGKIYPCVFERNTLLGDLSKQSLKEVLNSKELKGAWFLDFSKIDTCKDCEYRFGCKDCRALGMSKCHNSYEKNPRCLYNPYTAIWKKD